ncbi:MULTISPECIES: hypothetical protein [Streptomyces]|uniref:hypothetical protein n=1 Tax=Streptomyces TaxID=1883 RepID=UPI0006EBD635|nr:hypothetical protein A4U61_12575 [Streptomyces sp. H-KF8]
MLAGELLDETDEPVVKTYPIVRGTGLPVFGAGFSVTESALDSVRTFENGMPVRTYGRKRWTGAGGSPRGDGRDPAP